jgi:hypothetical protein
MILLVDKPLNFVKITGRGQELKCLEPKQRKMINISVNALQQVGLK